MSTNYNPANFQKYLRPMKKIIKGMLWVFVCILCAYVVMALISMIIPGLLNRIPGSSVYIPLFKTNIPKFLEQQNERILILYAYLVCLFKISFYVLLFYATSRIIKNSIQIGPFCRQNAASIRFFAWVLITYYLVTLSLYVSSLGLHVWMLYPYYNWCMPFSGILLLIIARGFRQGASLQQAYDDTL